MRILVSALVTTFTLWHAILSFANDGYAPLPVDDLQSIRSVISGRDAPQWSPDGSLIMDFQPSWPKT